METIDQFLLPTLTGLVGTVIGFGLTRLNDWLTEHRNLKRTVQHLRSEVANVKRHYEHTRWQVEPYKSSSVWLNSIHLETCRFYGNGLGSFDIGALGLLDDETSGKVMYLILMLRNNNAYIDQAMAHVEDQDATTFYAVCDELLKRFDATIEMSDRVRLRIDERYR